MLNLAMNTDINTGTALGKYRQTRDTNEETTYSFDYPKEGFTQYQILIIRQRIYNKTFGKIAEKP